MNDLSEFLEQLTPFDRLDLAAGAAALQLCPDNADHLLRLERLAGLVAAVPPSDQAGLPHLSASRWRSLINTAPIADADLVSQEDPFEEPYVDSLIFFGGNYRVMPGLGTGSVRIVRTFTDAIFQMGPGIAPEFEAACGPLLLGALRLSEALVERAGLARGTAPSPGKGKPAVVPAGPEFARLKLAVVFLWTELEEMVGPTSLDALRTLATQPGELSAPRSGPEPDDRILMSPLLDCGDSVVVVAPTALLSALRHRIIVTACEMGVREQLASRFRDAVGRSVGRSLVTMGFRFSNLNFNNAPAEVSESFWKFDADKVAHVLVVTDPMTDYDADELFGRWRSADLPSRVGERIVTVRKQLREQRGENTGILHLIVSDGVGRWSHLGLRDEASARRAYPLMVGSDDLGVIARLEALDPLALWKFARAGDALRDGTRVLQFSTLDEYALYRDHDHSFYLGDDRPPTLLNIQPAYAVKLRVDDVVGFDMHGATDPSGSTTVYVQRRFEKTDVPIYATDPLGDVVQFLVEGLPVPVWVVPDDTPSANYRAISFELCEAVAYWMWQASNVLSPVLTRLRGESARVVIRVAVTEGSGWFEQDAPEPQDEWLQIRTAPADSSVTLVFSPATHSVLAGSDNAGERLLVAALLHGVAGELAGDTTFGAEAAMEEVAPLGPKKKIIVLASNANLELEPGSLPQPRLVDPAETAFRLDELGKHLRGKLEVGPIAPEGRGRVLNDVVSYYFDRLATLVASLAPDGLLEALIAQHEALVRDEAERRLTMPTRLACFGIDEQLRQELEERLPTVAVTSTASRFVIEYVSAVPPDGTRQLDLEAYDELLSLAAELTNKGFLSDAIHFALADPQLSMLESGRLGISRGDLFQRALEQFAGVRARGEITLAQSHFRRHWRDPESPPDPPDYLQTLEGAFEAEFGLTTTETAHFLGTVSNFGRDLDGEPKTMTLADLRSAATDALGWSVEKVDTAIDVLSLSPREPFIGGSGSSDVFPWRFARDRSYTRRPLVQRGDSAGGEVLWGTRHLSRSGPYLLDLCLTGRLKATSAEMKKFIGSIRNVEPELFNDDVANLFEARTDLVVRRRVKKVGRLRLVRDNGESLGDVDVLVADPRRRKLLAIETKDFEVARTPAELANELKKLATGPKSTARLHDERVCWLRNHLHDVLEWLGTSSRHGKWRVEGLIVVSTELMSPLLHSVPMPVIHVGALGEGGCAVI